jgi:hypothetical protein
MSDLEVYAAAVPADARAMIDPPPSASDRALWFGVFGSPVAWSIDLLASVALHFDYCAALTGRTFRPWAGISVLLALIGLAMLALALASGGVAWRAHASLGTDTGQGDTDLDRRRFMARAGLLACALFSFGIVLRLIAPFMLPPTFCGS